MTAVNWLDEQLQDKMYFVYGYTDGVRKVTIPLEDYMRLKQEALELEKQQIIDAYWGGLNGSINDYSESKKVGSEIIDIKYGKGAEQYYNETYGSKGSDETKIDKI